MPIDQDSRCGVERPCSRANRDESLCVTAPTASAAPPRYANLQRRKFFHQGQRNELLTVERPRAKQTSGSKLMPFPLPTRLHIASTERVRVVTLGRKTGTPPNVADSQLDLVRCAVL